MLSSCNCGRVTDIQTDRQTDKQTDRQTDRRARVRWYVRGYGAFYDGWGTVVLILAVLFYQPLYI